MFSRRLVTLQKYVRQFSTLSNLPAQIPTKTIMYDKFGPPSEALTFVNGAINTSDIKGATWVLCKQLASPMNPADFNMIEGTYGTRATLPAIGGNEGCFEVVATGPGSNLRPGNWVVPVFPGVGTWRSHILGDSVDFLKVPQVGTPADVATVMVNPCTAFRMLEDFVHLKPGDIVIQNGATSGVGKAVIQICKARGIKTINIVRPRPNFADTRAALTELGADLVVEDTLLRDKEGIANLLKTAGFEGQKAKLVLNCVSGTATLDMARFVENKATIVTYGGMSKKPVMMGTGSFIFSDLILRGFWMTRWSQTHDPTDPERIRMLTALFAMIKEGKLKQDHEIVNVSTVEDVKSAVEKANSAHKPAKIVLTFE